MHYTSDLYSYNLNIIWTLNDNDNHSHNNCQNIQNSLTMGTCNRSRNRFLAQLQCTGDHLLTYNFNFQISFNIHFFQNIPIIFPIQNFQFILFYPFSILNFQFISHFSQKIFSIFRFLLTPTIFRLFIIFIIVTLSVWEQNEKNE
jgi:hypothetical protein